MNEDNLGKRRRWAATFFAVAIGCLFIGCGHTVIKRIFQPEPSPPPPADLVFEPSLTSMKWYLAQMYDGPHAVPILVIRACIKNIGSGTYRGPLTIGWAENEANWRAGIYTIGITGPECSIAPGDSLTISRDFRDAGQPQVQDIHLAILTQSVAPVWRFNTIFLDSTRGCPGEPAWNNEIVVPLNQ